MGLALSFVPANGAAVRFIGSVSRRRLPYGCAM